MSSNQAYIDSLQQSLSQLILGSKYTFWGVLLSMFDIRILTSEDKFVARLAYDPRTPIPFIEINSEWMGKMSNREIIFIMLHEAKHYIFLHIWRAENKDPEMWNIATDKYINEEGMTDIRGGEEAYSNGDVIADRYSKNPYRDDSHEDGPFELLYMGPEQRVSSHSADKVYRELLDDRKEQEKENGEGTSGPQFSKQVSFAQGPLGDSHKNWKEIAEGASAEEAESTVHDIIKSASHGIGELPGSIEEMIKGFHAPKVRWGNRLRQWIGRSKTQIREYSWGKLHSVVPDLLPGRKKKFEPHVGFIVDVSGSIADTEFVDFVSEMIFISKQMQCSYIEVDTGIQGELQPFKGQKVKQNGLNRTGYGGTDMQPGIDKMIKSNVDIMILLTDGYIPQLDVSKLKKPLIVVITSAGVKLEPNRRYAQLQIPTAT